MRGAARLGGMAGSTAIHAQGVEGAELDELVAGLRGLDAQVTQLGPGLCVGSFREVACSSLHILRASFTTRVAVRARIPRGSGLLQVVLGSSLVWNGRPVGAEHLTVVPGEADVALVLPAHAGLCTAWLEPDRLQARLRALGGGGLRLGFGGVVHCVPAAVQRGLRADLDALLQGGREARSAAVEGRAARIYDRVALALAAPVDARRPFPETRRQLLHSAEAYMRAHARTRFPLSELCRAVGCSGRTLRYAFHDGFGVSPGTYLKRLRLQGLRRDLLHAAPREATALELALRWGFWHLGHLGRDYKSFFGETPAATLARKARGPTSSTEAPFAAGHPAALRGRLTLPGSRRFPPPKPHAPPLRAQP